MTIHEPFHFPGPGGVSWTHRVETFGVRIEAVPEIYEADPLAAAGIAARQAERMLASEILKKGALWEGDEEGTRRHFYEWRVAVVLPDGNRNWFAEHVEHQRQEERRKCAEEIAEALLARAAGQRRAEGHCVHVLVHQLEESAALARRMAAAGEHLSYNLPATIPRVP